MPGACGILTPRGLRGARAASAFESVERASAVLSAFDFTPDARLGPRDDDTRLCIAWRAERRHCPRVGTEEAAPPRLPGSGDTTPCRMTGVTLHTGL